MMDLTFRVQFDGQDHERLEKVLRREVFAQTLEELMKHLYWWFHESRDEQSKAYCLAFEFVRSKLAEAGLHVEWEIFGKVRTRDGHIVEKTEADDPWKQKGGGQSAGAGTSAQPTQISPQTSGP